MRIKGMVDKILQMREKNKMNQRIKKKKKKEGNYKLLYLISILI